MSRQILFILFVHTLVACLTTATPLQKDQVVYERLAEKIAQKFGQQGELFENIANIQRIYSPKPEEKYTVVANDISIKGINFTHITGIKDAKATGSHSHSMQLTLNLGNPMLTSDVTVTPMNQKVDKPMKLKTTALTYGNDLEITATVTVNTQWKNVIPVTLQISQNPAFVSYSDCEKDIIFCDQFHTWIDGAVWSTPLYNSLIYVMKQALFKVVLDHEL